MDFERLHLTYFHAEELNLHDGLHDDFSCLPRPFASIAILIDGGWEFVQNFGETGRELRTGSAASGDIIYVPEGSTYSADWHNLGNLRCISLHFNLSGSIFSDRRTYVQSVALPVEGLCAEFERILSLYRSNGEDGELELMSRFYRLLSLIHPHLELCEDKKLDRRIEPALDYIRKHISEQLTVASLASVCSLSEPHFYSLFRRATGVTPIEYKNRAAISTAGQLLIDFPELSCEEISERLGFSSSSYFRRVFKRVSGMTPRDFRKNGMGRL